MLTQLPIPPTRGREPPVRGPLQNQIATNLGKGFLQPLEQYSRFGSLPPQRSVQNPISIDRRQQHACDSVNVACTDAVNASEPSVAIGWD